MTAGREAGDFCLACSRRHKVQRIQSQNEIWPAALPVGSDWPRTPCVVHTGLALLTARGAGSSARRVAQSWSRTLAVRAPNPPCVQS